MSSERPSWLSAMFGPGVVTAEGAPRVVDDELFPEELTYIRHAVEKRRAEFGTARVLARRALASLGVAPTALVPHGDRSPSWPDGVVGSISHTRDLCAVAVARRPALRSLGLDIEEVRALDEGVQKTILTPREVALLGAQNRARRDDVVMLLFSAKEAFYKCQYPVTGVFLSFQDVEVDIDLEGRQFEARAPRSGSRAVPEKLRGQFSFGQGKVACAIEWRD